MIVVVSDGLKLPVEFGQFDVVVHCRLVDFHNFDATSKNGFLDESRFFFHAGFRECRFKAYVFFICQLDAVTMYGRICFGLSSHFFP